jgi:hypothetical protein
MEWQESKEGQANLYEYNFQVRHLRCDVYNYKYTQFIFIVAPCILKIHQLLKPTNALIYIVLF